MVGNSLGKGSPSVPGLAQIVVEHYGATGTSFLWEQQLLNQGGSNRR
jgi:hypothetical protein